MTDFIVRQLVRETLRSSDTDTIATVRVRQLVRETLRSNYVSGQATTVSFRQLVRETLRSRQGPTTGHGKKAKVTVQSSKVTGASISDYVVFLTEIHLPALIFDATSGALSDGGDIRAYNNSAGATEYPIDIVVFDKTNSKALICVKLPSVGSGANTDFYLFWGNPGLSLYPAADIYGRHAVWNDYSFVAFFNGTTLTSDRTRGNRTLTFAGSPTAIDGPYSKATRFNGTTGSMIAASTTVTLGAEVTMTVVARRVGNGDANARIATARAGAATQGLSLNLLTGASDALSASIYTSGGVATNFGAHAMGAGWNEIVLTSNTVGPAHELFVDNVSSATNAAAVRATTTAGRVAAASSLTTSSSENAQVDISMILIEPRISSDRRASAFTNRNDSGFTDTVIEHQQTLDVGQSPTLQFDIASSPDAFQINNSPTVELDAQLTGGSGTEYPLALDINVSPLAEFDATASKLLPVEIEAEALLQRDIARTLVVAAAADPELQKAIARTFAVQLAPEATLGRSAGLGLTLELTTSPLAYVALEAAKLLQIHLEAEAQLERAIAKQLTVEVSPTPMLDKGRQILASLTAAAGVDVVLERAITKVFELRADTAAQLDRLATRARTFTLSATAAVLINRGLAETFTITTEPTVQLGRARTLVQTLTATVTATLDLIRGYLDASAITDRVAILAAEARRIATLPREALRVTVVPRERRLATLAREIVRVMTPSREADRVPTIPAEPSRVIELPADEDRVAVIPPER